MHPGVPSGTNKREEDMALTWDLSKVKDSKELWVHDGYLRLRWFKDGESDPEEGFWVKTGNSFRQATDEEVSTAKNRAADELTTVRESKHHPEIQVHMLPSDVGLYQKGYKVDSRTEALIWLSLSTVIGEITEENHEEVFRRVQVIEKKHGAMLGDSEEAVFFTMADVKRRIGLKTNAAFRDESSANFDKRMAKIKTDREEVAT